MSFIKQDVRLGYLEGPQLSLDLDESGSGINTQLSSSPPNTGRTSPTQPTTPGLNKEPMELQVDYWPMIRPIGDGREKNQTKGLDMGKNSVKSTFRNLQVTTKQFECRFCFNSNFFIFVSGMETSTLSTNR